MRTIRPLICILNLFALAALVCPVGRGAESKERPVGAWAADLKAPEVKARSQAAVALGRLGPAAAPAVPALTLALRDPDKEVRANAAWALAQLGTVAKTAAPGLAQSLTDSSWEVRGRAALALGAIGTDAAAAQFPLRRALRDEHPSVRAAAAGALWSVAKDAKEPAAVLQALLADPSPETRRQAAQAVGRVGQPAAALTPQLLHRLDDENAGVRLAVARALVPLGVGNEQVRSALERRLASERDTSVRQEMSSALQRIQLRPATSIASRSVASRDGVPAPITPRPAEDRPKPPAAATTTPPASHAPTTTTAIGAARPPAPAPEVTPPSSRAPAQAARPRAPEPAHGGKALSTWIAQLRASDAGERRAAAVALGEIGPAARPAVGPLNEVRLADAHDTVRQQAALALARILGVALGDMLPKARSGPAPSAAPPAAGLTTEGRIYYLSSAHTVSEDGVEPRPGRTRDDDSYRQYLFGFTNLTLNYLDVAEAQRYREDARRRGLDVRLRLPELLQSEPAGERERIGMSYRFFHSYKNDYVVRITCNRQTRYAYYRWLGDRHESFGSGSHWAMTPGPYTAEITLWLRDGGRLDFKVTFASRGDVKADAGDRLRAAKAGGPLDLVRDELRAADAITPGNTDYSRRTYPARKASAHRRVGDRLIEFLPLLGHCQPMPPDGVLPYVREIIAQYRKAAGFDPKSKPLAPEDLRTLVQTCLSAGTQEAYALATEFTGLIEKSVAAPPAKGAEGAYRSAHYERALCYLALSELALVYQMDVGRALRYRIRAFQYKDLCDGILASTLRATDVGKKLAEWPQPGWWNPADDELQPAFVAELSDEKTAPPRPDAAPSRPAVQVAAVPARTLDDAVTEVDEKRAEEAAWLIELRRNLTRANDEMGAAKAKLALLHRALLAVQQKMDYFGKLLSEASARPGDAEWLEEQLFNALKDSEAIRGDLAAPTRGGVGRMRDVLNRIVDDLAQRQAKLEGERDALIQEVLLEYGSIAQSLEKRGPQCTEPLVREGAEKALGVLRTIIKLRQAELALAAGQGDAFRAAARACTAEGDQDIDYQVRLMESAHLESEGKLSLALKAARLALAARQESPEPARRARADGTSVSEPTPAQNLVKRLELEALKGIAAKTAQDSALVRKLCEEQIGVHGDAGIKGFAYDVVFMGRFISAKGENSIITSFYDWITGGGELKLPESPISATPVEKEETQAGKPESLAREMGVVLDDATRTCLGLTIIQKLRAHDVPLSKISTMSAAEFRRVVADTLGREQNGERWRKLSDAQVMKMRSELHFALQQADVERLVEGRSQVLDLETGRSYYDTESFTGNWRDAVEDQVNVFNVLLLALPNAQVAKAGRQVGLLKWAHPAIGGAESVALKQVVAEAVGVSRALDWASRHELGGRLVKDLVDTHSRMSWFGKAATDAILQQDVTEWTKYGVEYAVGELGYDRATQEKAGRVAEVVAQIGTSFAMDLDTTVSLAGDVLNPTQARIVASSLSDALGNADEMSRLADSPQAVLRRALAEAEGGRISAAQQRLARQAADQLEQSLDSLRKALPAAADAHPLVNAHYEHLQALYDGLQAAAEGMPGQAKRFSAFAEELGEKLAESRTSLVRQASVVQAASAPRFTKPDLGKQQFTGEHADFQLRSSMPVADELMQRSQYRQAAKLYEAGYYVYDELGMADDRAAQLLASRWRLAKQLEQAEAFIERMKLNADPNAGIARPVTDAELAALRAAPDFRLERIGKGASGPCWVIVGGKRVGIFKPMHELFPFAREGEELGARLARHLDLPAAAVARTKMPLDHDMPGTFARYLEGAEATGALGRSTVDDLLQLKQTAGGLEYIPVGPEAPDAFWAVAGGKRVGIFAPSYARFPDAGGADAAFNRLAKAAGGEVLDTVPTTMRLKQAEGTFIRFIDGEDLIKFTDAERIVLKRKIAKDWVLRLVLGDYDAHALNFKLAANGELIPIDRNLADILEVRSGTLDRVLGKTTLSADPAEMQQEIEQLMRYRLQILGGVVEGSDTEHYRCMKRVAEQMTLEDFREPLDAVKKWDRAFLTRELGQTFGHETDRAIQVIEARLKSLERVLKAFPSVAPPKTAWHSGVTLRFVAALPAPEPLPLAA